MPTLTAVLAARTPSPAGPPQLVEVDRLVAATLSYTDELNRAGTASLTCRVATMAPAVKAQLRDLAATPSEVWIYRDQTLAWAGAVESVGVQAQTATIGCTGLLGYLTRMGVRDDVAFAGVDQHTIVRQLVDGEQARSYGHYGIDTSGISLSGVVRQQQYLQRDLKDVLSVVTELGKTRDGFDLAVDPATRQLRLFHPRRGADLSAGVILDGRTLASATVTQSAGPDDVVSDVGAMSGAQDETGLGFSLYSARERAAVQRTFGRSWRGQSFDNVGEQTALDGLADAYLDDHGQQRLQPGVSVQLNPGTGVVAGAFGPGDTVAYSFDAGLGLQTGRYRVGKVTTSAGEGRQLSMGVDFL